MRVIDSSNMGLYSRCTEYYFLTRLIYYLKYHIQNRETPVSIRGSINELEKLYNELKKYNQNLKEPSEIFLNKDWTLKNFELYCEEVQETTSTNELFVKLKSNKSFENTIKEHYDFIDKHIVGKGNN